MDELTVRGGNGNGTFGRVGPVLPSSRGFGRGSVGDRDGRGRQGAPVRAEHDIGEEAEKASQAVQTLDEAMGGRDPEGCERFEEISEGQVEHALKGYLDVAG